MEWIKVKYSAWKADKLKNKNTQSHKDHKPNNEDD